MRSDLLAAGAARAHFSDEFADALARAEDPSPAVLRDAPEAEMAVADAHERARRAPAAEAEAADWALPRELPAAEAMVVAEPDLSRARNRCLNSRGAEPEPRAPARACAEHEPGSVAELARKPCLARSRNPSRSRAASPSPCSSRPARARAGTVLEAPSRNPCRAEAEPEPEPVLELVAEPCSKPCPSRNPTPTRRNPSRAECRAEPESRSSSQARAGTRQSSRSRA